MPAKIILDANIVDAEVRKLRSYGFKVSRLGIDVGAQYLTNGEVIRLLHGIRHLQVKIFAKW